MTNRFVILIAAVIAACTLASTADAHAGGWYWSVSHAETYVLNNFTTSDGVDIDTIDCRGTGRRWRGLYHHFTCDQWDTDDRYFEITVHPISRRRARVIEEYCDDTDSYELTCP